MRNNKEKQHAVDILFVLILFCVFTLTSMAVVYSGSRVHSDTVDTMDINFHNHVGLDYVSEKLHQAKGRVQLQKMDGMDVLCIEEQVEKEAYITYIYCDKKELKELCIHAKDAFKKENGETIMKVDRMQMNVVKNVLQLEIANNQKVHKINISLPLGGA